MFACNMNSILFHFFFSNSIEKVPIIAFYLSACLFAFNLIFTVFYFFPQSPFTFTKNQLMFQRKNLHPMILNNIFFDLLKRQPIATTMKKATIGLLITNKQKSFKIPLDKFTAFGNKLYLLL